MKKRMFAAYVLTLLIGIGWHSLYIRFPLPLVALIAPASESVWEHLKLVYFPVFPAIAVLCSRQTGSRQPLLCGFLAALAAMPPLLVSAWYVLTEGFAVTWPLLGPVLYALVLAAGFFIAAQYSRRGCAPETLGKLTMYCGVWGAALIVFTLAAPPFPIFGV